MEFDAVERKVLDAWSAVAMPTGHEFASYVDARDDELHDDQIAARKAYMGRRFDAIDCRAGVNEDPLFDGLLWISNSARTYYLAGELLCQLREFDLGKDDGYWKLRHIISMCRSGDWNRLVDFGQLPFTFDQCVALRDFLILVKEKSSLHSSVIREVEESISVWSGLCEQFSDGMHGGAWNVD